MQLNVKTATPQDPFAAARLTMVDSQIRPNRVADPVLLDAMETTSRELFAASSHKALAYLEGDCPAGSNRLMLTPTILARMLDALQLTKADTVLDVGGMTGYSSAIIAALSRQVTLLESDAGLAAEAEKNFKHLSITNARVRIAPFDRQPTENYSAIFVGGAIAQVPETLAAQLTEGGRMVAIIGGDRDTAPGAVTLFTKLHGSLSHRVLFEASAAFLPGMAARKAFVF